MNYISTNLKLNNKTFKLKINKKDILSKNQKYSLAEKFGSSKLKSLNWYRDGYAIIDVFNKKEHDKNILKISTELIKMLKIDKKKNFKVQKYHEMVSDNEHTKLIKKTREIDPKKFNQIKDKIYKVINKKYNLKFERNLKLKKEICILRLNRPGKQDMNPPHRDGYIKSWSKCVNIWYMTSGCRKTSSLPLVPKSHLLTENKILVTKPKSKMNGIKYHVPIIFKILKKKNIPFLIPKIKPGQVLIFSPYLIHGFGYNFGLNTRSAIELRPKIKE